MAKRLPAALVVLFSPLAWIAASGQSSESAQPLESVEIRAAAPNTMPQMRSRFGNGRYELRNATAVDLIRTAWGVDADSISGGPDWLDLNRYDIAALAPATSTPQMLHAALQSMLKDRFRLSIRHGTRYDPAFTITASNKPRLKPAEAGEESGCKLKPAPSVPRTAPQPDATLVCVNVTIPAFARALAGPTTSGYLFDYPLLDRTGLAGAWDFTLTWSPRQANSYSPPPANPTTLFDAFDQQLGLKLTLTKISTPVLVVENATPPRVSTAPKPRVEFEVAEIRPMDPSVPVDICNNVAIQPGGRVRIQMTLRDMIWESYGAPFDFSRIIGGAKGMSSPCWEIVAKAAVEQNALGTPSPIGWNGPIWNGVDLDTMRMSLRSFLEDRFKLVSHMEDRPIDGYVLTASRPKLKKANPANRANCKEGPGDDGKDPRLTNPLATRLITCRNMTLTQFASELSRLFPGSPPMTDATGISGRFDMTLNFSPWGVAQAIPSNTPGAESAQASDPSGAISLYDALKGQLGLKVETRKVMAPVVIVDSVNETPTDN